MANRGLIKGPRLRPKRRRHPFDLAGRRDRLGRRRERRAHPSLVIFPNLFTSASLFLSLFAIVKISEGVAGFETACWLILLAAVCDAIDGPVARLTRSASNFGLQFDSLADVVAFGVAPAFLMYSNLRVMDNAHLPSYAPKLALGACALYSICSAIRLARFNVQADTAEKRYFTGLPTPGAAGGVVSAFLFVSWLSTMPLMESAGDTRWLTINMHRSILLLMVGLALLMVSEIPFPKLKSLLLISRNHFNTLVVMVILVCLAITFQDYLPAMIFAAFMIYTLGAVSAEARRRLKKRFQHGKTA